MRFAVIGGDMRARWLCDLLRADGQEVSSFALGQGTDAGTLREALEGARFAVLPVPMLTAGGSVNAPFFDGALTVSELAGSLPEGATVLGGMVPDALPFRAVDYFKREELTVRNAAITAEGAVEILMRELPIAVSDGAFVIVGAGRIGKLLAIKLRALGASVTVTARREGDLALIRELGCESVGTDRLRFCAGGADAVINTVPARVIDRRVLGAMRRDALLLDLASRPFGHDPEEAALMHVRAITAPGLPGKAAPRSAAMAIRDTIYNIVNEL